MIPWDQLLETVKGHEFSYTDPNDGKTYCTNDFHAGPTTQCWRAEVSRWVTNNERPDLADDDVNNTTMRIANELVAACFENKNHMITKYIFVGELIDNDGRRMFFSDTSPDIRAWESLGILELARVREQNRLMQQRLEGTDE